MFWSAAPAEINDELAKKLGMEDVKALREAIEQQINAEYEGFSKMKLKRQLLDILDEKHDFEIPAGMAILCALTNRLDKSWSSV